MPDGSHHVTDVDCHLVACLFTLVVIRYILLGLSILLAYTVDGLLRSTGLRLCSYGRQEEQHSQ